MKSECDMIWNVSGIPFRRLFCVFLNSGRQKPLSFGKNIYHCRAGWNNTKELMLSATVRSCARGCCRKTLWDERNSGKVSPHQELDCVILFQPWKSARASFLEALKEALQTRQVIVLNVLFGTSKDLGVWRWVKETGTWNHFWSWPLDWRWEPRGGSQK